MKRIALIVAVLLGMTQAQIENGADGDTCQTAAQCSSKYCNALTNKCEDDLIDCGARRTSLPCDQEDLKCVEVLEGVYRCLECEESADCSGTRVCVDYACVQCAVDNDCQAGKICNQERGLCVNCLPPEDGRMRQEDSTCATGQFCTSFGVCVQCLEDSDCNSGSCEYYQCAVDQRQATDEGNNNLLGGGLAALVGGGMPLLLAAVFGVSYVIGAATVDGGPYVDHGAYQRRSSDQFFNRILKTIDEAQMN